MITIIMMVAVVMQVIDTTIANVALPHMMGSLAATQDQISWVLTSYIVAAAIMTPATGWIAGRVGRTRLFAGCLAGFTIVSVLCGLAQSLPQMVVFRVFQGLFGAALIPVSQAVMLDTFPKEEQTRAMAIWSMGIMVGPILGPILGGYLTEAYDWRWCFYINLPVGILATLGTLAYVPETTRSSARKFDWFGFFVLSVGITALQLVFDRGEHKGWFESSEILIEAALAGLGFYLFAVHMATTTRPFVDVRLFKDRTFVICMLLQIGVISVFYGSMVLAPQMLQQELRYPVFLAGLLMAPRGVGTLLSMFTVSRIAGKVPPVYMIGFGFIVMAYSMYLMSNWSLMVSATPIVIAGLIQGFGQGFIFAPINSIAFAQLPAELRTEGSGFFSLVRNIGSALGVSVAVSQLTQLTQLNHAYLTEHITPYSGGMTMLHGMSGALGAKLLNMNITHQAGMVAYVNVFRLMAIACIVALPLLAFMRPPKQAAPPKPEEAGEAMAH